MITAPNQAPTLSHLIRTRALWLFLINCSKMKAEPRSRPDEFWIGTRPWSRIFENWTSKAREIFKNSDHQGRGPRQNSSGSDLGSLVFSHLNVWMYSSALRVKLGTPWNRDTCKSRYVRGSACITLWIGALCISLMIWSPHSEWQLTFGYLKFDFVKFYQTNVWNF